MSRNNGKMPPFPKGFYVQHETVGTVLVRDHAWERFHEYCPRDEQSVGGPFMPTQNFLAWLFSTSFERAATVTGVARPSRQRYPWKQLRFYDPRLDLTFIVAKNDGRPLRLMTVLKGL